MGRRSNSFVIFVMVAASWAEAMAAGSFDITSFGARAGADVDNSPAIRKAIETAAAAGGGTVVFPAAAQPYGITDSIRVNADNIHIVAGGAAVFLADGAGTGRNTNEDMVHVVRIQGTPDRPIENVSVRGLAIDANYWGQTNNTASYQGSVKLAGNTRGIMVNHARHVTIEDVTIDRPFAGMTFGLGSHHCEARRVKVTRFHHDGFGVTPEYTDGGATHIVYRECVAADSPHGARGGLPGIRIKGWEIEEGAQHVKVIDCVVRDTDANGFYVRPHGSKKSFHTGHIELIRCRVENAGRNAFAIFGQNASQPVTHITLTDCVAEHGAIALYRNPDEVVIRGGHFENAMIGFYRVLEDPHHFPDMLGEKQFRELPVRSVTLEDVRITKDVRINAAEGHDRQQAYLPNVTLTRVRIGGDVYVVGEPASGNEVRFIDSSVGGRTRHVSMADYMRPLYEARKQATMGAGVVRRAASPPVLDGKADDACWLTAEPLDIVNKYGSAAGRRGGHTTVQVSHDERALYVLMECLESDMDRLQAAGTQRDADLWFDDCVEVFVHREQDPPGYFRQWMVNAAGVLYDGDKHENDRWNSHATVAVARMSDRWVVEMVIPWKDIGGRPQAGQALKANFTRHRTADQARWIWSWRYDADEAFADVTKMGTLTIGG